jgi:hypothetical protein
VKEDAQARLIQTFSLAERGGIPPYQVRHYLSSKLQYTSIFNEEKSAHAMLDAHVSIMHFPIHAHLCVCG